MKNRKRCGLLMMIAGIAGIVTALIIFCIERHWVMENVAIIGGADLPTILYMQNFGGFPRVPVLVTAGSGMLMLGILFRRGNSK